MCEKKKAHCPHLKTSIGRQKIAKGVKRPPNLCPPNEIVLATPTLFMLNFDQSKNILTKFLSCCVMYDT